MNTSLKTAFFVAMLVWLGLGNAEVYKHVDRNGVVHYSDERGPGAKAVELPEISVYPFRIPVSSSPPPSAESADPKSASSSSEIDDRDVVEEFRILEPKNNSTLSPSDAAISIRIVLQPKLKADQSLVLLLDGRPAEATATGTGSDLSITNVTSGSHVLEARVVDGKGQLVRRAKSVLFHVP